MKTFPSNQPADLRGALDLIDTLLRAEYGHDLWNILTALRGPDSRNRGIKYATTCVIRNAAFPGRPTNGLSVFKDDCPLYAKRRERLFDEHEESNHFREHIQDAFDSLGMTIDKVNGEDAS